jgi:hypothetical protein
MDCTGGPCCTSTETGPGCGSLLPSNHIRDALHQHFNCHWVLKGPIMSPVFKDEPELHLEAKSTSLASTRHW